MDYNKKFKMKFDFFSSKCICMKASYIDLAFTQWMASETSNVCVDFLDRISKRSPETFLYFFYIFVIRLYTFIFKIRRYNQKCWDHLSPITYIRKQKKLSYHRGKLFLHPLTRIFSLWLFPSWLSTLDKVLRENIFISQCKRLKISKNI